MTADLLATVVAASRRSAEERARRTAPELHRRVDDRARPSGTPFESALRAPGIHVIAECKRRSPSRGVLRESYDPAAVAQAYEAAGAAAISVLTEPTFFDGSLDHLRAVRRAVAVPILCKDFIVTEFQIWEAADAGADAVLLIVRALDDGALARLMACARALGLAALVEVHDRAELDRALAAGATVIGVNSRNLQTLEVDRAIFLDLAPHIPPAALAVAESGLDSGDDMRRLKSARYDAFLIGERLITQLDPGATLESLLTDAVGGERP
jgi:indole-3-glycerol phosphate synthase